METPDIRFTDYREITKQNEWSKLRCTNTRILVTLFVIAALMLGTLSSTFAKRKDNPPRLIVATSATLTMPLYIPGVGVLIIK